MKTGIELIAEERTRQRQSEMWSESHDDGHTKDQLARAAMRYVTPEWMRNDWLKEIWPWERRWWKPTPHDRVRELVKAGALIAAEIDRIQRKEQSDVQ